MMSESVTSHAALNAARPHMYRLVLLLLTVIVISATPHRLDLGQSHMAVHADSPQINNIRTVTMETPSFFLALGAACPLHIL